MGAKSSNNFQSDRPESGGADKDMQREKSGLLDRDQEKFAQKEREVQQDEKPESPEGVTPFSIDNPPRNDRRE